MSCKLALPFFFFCCPSRPLNASSGPYLMCCADHSAADAMRPSVSKGYLLGSVNSPPICRLLSPAVPPPSPCLSVALGAFIRAQPPLPPSPCVFAILPSLLDTSSFFIFDLPSLEIPTCYNVVGVFAGLRNMWFDIFRDVLVVIDWTSMCADTLLLYSLFNSLFITCF